MNTRCPQCGTVYAVDSASLTDTHGKARCYQCNTIFDATLSAPKDPPSTTAAPQADAALIEDSELQFSFEVTLTEQPDINLDLDAEIPALEPSEQAALDVHDTLSPKPKNRTPAWQKLLLGMLILLLIGQLLWWMRIPLLQQPAARPLCAYLDCSVAQQSNPRAYSIVERSLLPDSQIPNALRLWVRIRNDADFAQPLPSLQLTLSDNTGSTLARRSLSPREYLYPPPDNIPLTTPGEVTAIEVLFEDPGSRASGFEITFF